MNSDGAALFGMFCVIDRFRAIENGPDKGELSLIYKKGNNSILLNDDNLDLHELFKSD